jgi:hypothetical protein
MQTSVTNPETMAYPALSALGVSAAELTAIAAQGFLNSERRGDQTNTKLRFRINGKQRVKYIRPQTLTTVKAELEQLQASKHLRAALRAQTKEARRYLKEAQLVLDAMLANEGLHFHGRQLRVVRQLRPPQAAECHTRELIAEH